MNNYLGWFEKLVPDRVRHGFANRYNKGPIITVDNLAEFVQTRSAFVMQTSLFGYLKERMGTSYPRYFEDETFVAAIRISQKRAFRACASDLAIFAVALTMKDSELTASEAADLAEQCFTYALNNSGAEDDEVLPEDIERFRERARAAVWANAAIGENAFTISPPELIDSAPVIDQFKELDREIVTNSIRFRWRDIREQLRKRIQPAEIYADFRSSQ